MARYCAQRVSLRDSPGAGREVFFERDMGLGYAQNACRKTCAWRIPDLCGCGPLPTPIAVRNPGTATKFCGLPLNFTANGRGHFTLERLIYSASVAACAAGHLVAGCRPISGRLPRPVPAYLLADGAAGPIGFLFSIVFHELSHAPVGRRFDVKVKGIPLFIFSAAVELKEEPVSRKVEFLMAVPGPLASLLLAFLLAQAGERAAGPACAAVVGRRRIPIPLQDVSGPVSWWSRTGSC